MFPGALHQELWGITVALAHEAEGFLPKFSVSAETRFRGLRVWEGRLGAKECVLLQTGMGPLRAEKAARYLLKEYPVTHLLSTGYCGGLREGIANGDAVIADTLLGEGDSLKLEVDPNLLREGMDMCKKLEIPVHRGALITVSRPVLKRLDKQKLAQKSSAIAVDMESFSVLREVRESGKKIASFSIRFVVDAVGDELTDTEAFFDPESGLKPLGLLREAVRRPSIMLKLPGLERKASHARVQLTKFIRGWFGVNGD